MSEEKLDDFSTNERAERLMGRRPTDVVAFDWPCELGYWCPACKVPALTDGKYDERLHWSEYNGFLWCEVCNKDYPSALCVPLDATPDPDRPWVHAGIESAIETYLDTIEQALDHQSEAS